jgi:hypothetical protein
MLYPWLLGSSRCHNYIELVLLTYVVKLVNLLTSDVILDDVNYQLSRIFLFPYQIAKYIYAYQFFVHIMLCF